MKKEVSTWWLGVLALLFCTSALWAEPAQDRKIDLNQATLEDLKELPGIGTSTAKRILEFREKNGPFERIEDLMNVRGIGERKFLKLKDRITVGPTGKPSARGPSSRR